MLRFGLLGCDEEIAEVALAARRRGNPLVAGHGVASPWDERLAIPPIASWEPLLDARTCDVVLVGSAGWNDRRAEAVRMLVQAGRPLVLAQPLELSMLWAYELDMIRRDSGAVLVPCLPDRHHPLVARLRAAIEDAGAAGIGTAESLTIERRMHDRARAAVLAQLSRDADLVRVLAGEPARLATLGSSAADAVWPTLAVGFSGDDHLPARWQVAPFGTPPLTIRLQGSAGIITVDAATDGAAWAWNGVPDTESFAGRGDAVLQDLDAALGRTASATPDGSVPPATWSDAARAIELAETVPRSLARGRAIDLHREEFTDLGTFRGTMASLGCGLIMIALVVVVGATIVAGLAREFGWAAAGGVVDAWPALVLAVLGIFLALQILPLLVRGGDGPAGPSSPSSPPPRS